MSADPVRQTYWVFTNQSLFEIVIGNEDRDVWKIYLEKGRFDTALRFSKVFNGTRQFSEFLANQILIDSVPA